MTDTPATDEIAAAEHHHGAIARRVDALHRRVDHLPGGRTALRVLVACVGGAFILAGAAMLVLPGPGWLTIFLGLAILGTEFSFARRINDWLRTQVRRMWAWWKARRGKDGAVSGA
ncbi:PGPGW domain-containing protein [Cellulomonas edaphi]|uniref:PGPGW domain-containing protein n=1 Tax=Cellulomonas edaphi TaxID=3053468 RepID=A0ABT7S386_9CELL|nr:PGPGW domain-containing protein [Cellulomons edaphi]MDM7830072.1 PGPGW domain-containing protein [Cellulomons edaphi]